MRDEDAVARGMAFMNGFDENHPTLTGVAQVLASIFRGSGASACGRS